MWAQNREGRHTSVPQNREGGTQVFLLYTVVGSVQLWALLNPGAAKPALEPRFCLIVHRKPDFIVCEFGTCRSEAQI